MGRLTVTVAVRMRPEEAEAVRAEARRSGRSLAALLLAGAGLAAAVPVGGAGGAAVLPDDLAELRARVDALELRAVVGNRRRDDRRRPTTTTADPSPTMTGPSPKRTPSPTMTGPSAGSLALRA